MTTVPFLLILGLAYWLLVVVANKPFLRERKLEQAEYTWIANFPEDFHHRSFERGETTDARSDSIQLKVFDSIISKAMNGIDYGDGEIVDVLDHFFWGQTEGLAMEMGAVDGVSHSQTFDMEQLLDWKRILVEGNPLQREHLTHNSPRAFSVSAAICEEETKVHFTHRKSVPTYSDGIAEFMDSSFLQHFHPMIWEAGNPYGDLSTVDWSKIHTAEEIDCIPLSKVFAEANVRHINFFILDVEVRIIL